MHQLVAVLISRLMHQLVAVLIIGLMHQLVAVLILGGRTLKCDGVVAAQLIPQFVAVHLFHRWLWFSPHGDRIHSRS